MYFDDYVDELVEDEEDECEGESDSSSLDFDDVESAVPSRERVFLRLPTARSSATMHDAAKLPLQQQVDSPERSTGHNLDSDTDKAEKKEEEGSNVRLEAGLVDYCVMLGQYCLIILCLPV